MQKQSQEGLAIIWAGFLDRLRVSAGAADPSLTTLSESLFLIRSVVSFVALRSGRDACFRHRAIRSTWRRAARQIIDAPASSCPRTASTALLALRNALDRVRMDGATCLMMDGIEALERGALAEAAEIGRCAWVRDGKAQALGSWLGAEYGRSRALDEAVDAAHLVAWALHEVSLSWRGTRSEQRRFASALMQAADERLFHPLCRPLLAHPALHPLCTTTPPPEPH